MTPWCYLPNITLFPNSVYLHFLPCVSNLSTQEHAFVSPTKHPGVTNLVHAEHCGKIKKRRRLVFVCRIELLRYERQAGGEPTGSEC